MSNPTPEQFDLPQPIDRVVKQIVDLAAAEREAKAWWQAILRLVPKEHHAPADAVRYVEERLNAWGGLLAVAGFGQDAGAAAGHHIASDLLAHRHLRGELARHLGHPKDAPSDALLSHVVDLIAKLKEERDQREAAQRQAAAWDIQAQDLRDELTDFRNQVARALGAEPSSLTTDEMLRQVGEGAAARRAHADLVEALHVERPAIEVTSDELVELAKQTYAHRYVAERLLAAVRAQLPQFVGQRHDDTLLWPLRELWAAIDRGYITQAIWAHRAWDAIVSRFNAQSAKTALPFESADTEAAILSAIDVGAQLQRWMREQVKTEAKG